MTPSKSPHRRAFATALPVLLLATLALPAAAQDDASTAAAQDADPASTAAPQDGDPAAAGFASDVVAEAALEEYRAKRDELAAAAQAVTDARAELDAASEAEAGVAQAELDEATAAFEEAKTAVLALLTRGGEYGLDVAAEQARLQEELGIELELDFSAAELEEQAQGKDVEELLQELGATVVRFDIELAKRDAALVALSGAEDADKPAAQAAYDEAQASFDAVADEFQAIVTVLDDEGEDVTEYQQKLVVARGASAENMSTAVVLGLLDQWITSVKDWLVENGPSLIFKAALFIIILLAFRLLGTLVARLVRRALGASRLKVSDLLTDFATGMTRKIVMVLGVLVALSSIGISVGPLLAGVGVLGFVIGFALQDTLSNFASGIMLLLYRPYDVGDLVIAGAETGKVEAMTMVSTSILTLDNQLVIVPNNAIWGNTITNVTAKSQRRVDMVFGIGYGDDIPAAEKVIEEVLTSHEKVLKDPEPTIKVHNLGESSVDFIVRPWCRTDDYWDVYWDITRTLKMRFDEEGISIPFPQRDVHMFPTGAEASNGAGNGSGRELVATAGSERRAGEADLRDAAAEEDV